MDAKPIAQQFVDDIKAVVDRYRDQGITNVEAMGALEIIKLDIYGEAQDDDESGSQPDEL